MSQKISKSLGRCLAALEYPRINEEKDSVQMTARLTAMNNVYLLSYMNVTNKNKNDCLNEILELGFEVLTQKLEETNHPAKDLFNNETHEVAENIGLKDNDY